MFGLSASARFHRRLKNNKCPFYRFLDIGREINPALRFSFFLRSIILDQVECRTRTEFQHVSAITFIIDRFEVFSRKVAIDKIFRMRSLSSCYFIYFDRKYAKRSRKKEKPAKKYFFLSLKILINLFFLINYLFSDKTIFFSYFLLVAAMHDVTNRQKEKKTIDPTQRGELVTQINF